jgi:hypothetical protein
MATGRRPKRKETASAQVFLRSVSGRSVRECALGPLPSDLAPFRPRPQDLDAAVRCFESLGFMVHRDEMGLALTIDASAERFSQVFGIPVSRVSQVSAVETVRLQPPDPIRGLVEDIVLTPKPEWF